MYTHMFIHIHTYVFHILCIHSAFDGYLACFHLMIINNATMNMSVKFPSKTLLLILFGVFWWFFFDHIGKVLNNSLTSLLVNNHGKHKPSYSIRKNIALINTLSLPMTENNLHHCKPNRFFLERFEGILWYSIKSPLHWKAGTTGP